MHIVPDPALASLQIPFPDINSFLMPLMIFITGIVITYGIIVWLIMFNPSSILIFSFLVLCLLISFYSLSSFYIYSNKEWFMTLYHLFGIGQGVSWLISFVKNLLFIIFPSCRKFSLSLIYIVFHAVYFYYLIMFFVYLFITIRARLLGKKERIFLLIIFLSIFVCIVPWQYLGILNTSILGGTYLFLSAIFAITWLNLLLFAHGYYWKTPEKDLLENSGNSPYIEERVSFLCVGYLLPLCFAILTLISHLQTGTIEKCIAYFRGNSLPATLKEMNEKYSSVPQKENIARKYYDLFPLCRDVILKEMDFEKLYQKEIDEKFKTQEEKEYLKIILNRFYGDIIRYDKPLSENLYWLYKEVYEKVYKKLTQKLHETAESGLTK
ncbi:MAG: hypothetical protein ACP5KS_14200, partial [Candidatus Hydrogenedens sp.]